MEAPHPSPHAPGLASAPGELADLECSLSISDVKLLLWSGRKDLFLGRELSARPVICAQHWWLWMGPTWHCGVMSFLGFRSEFSPLPASLCRLCVGCGLGLALGKHRGWQKPMGKHWSGVVTVPSWGTEADFLSPGS